MITFPKYEAYQDSGIDWAHKIPSTWKVERAKWLFNKMQRPVRPEDEVVTAFRDGEVTLRKNRREEGFTNALQEHGYQGIRKGDLIIHAMDAFAGAIGVSDSEGKSTPVYSVCTPRGEFYVNNHYYAYLLRYMALSGYIQSLTKGIRERSTDFRFKDFADLCLPIPSQEEQDRIVEFLDRKTAEIDEAIAHKQRLIELLQEQKAILINQAVTKGLNPNVPMRDSGIVQLGMIPESWKLIPIKHMVQTRKGAAFKADKFCDKGVRVVRASDIKNNIIKASDVFLPENFKKIYPKAILRSGEIILSTVGSVPDIKESAVGQMGIVPKDLDGTLLNQNTVVFNLTSDEIHKEFFSYFLISHSYRKHLDLHAHGSANQASLNVSDMLNYSLPYPKKSEQTAIALFLKDSLSESNNSINETLEEIDLLSEMKAVLIAKTVTGKIKI